MSSEVLHEAVPQSWVRNRFRVVGSYFFSGIRSAGGFGILASQIFREMFRPPLYASLILEQILHLGIRSLVLVLVVGLATGSVMALQFGYGLAKFGGTLYVPKIVSLSILREMGPVFTSLLLAGRIGSGIAAEVASMKVTQQIDAIRALGTSPIKRIVIPRFVATALALPLLTVVANYIGIVGGMLVSTHELGINPEFFYAKTVDTVTVWDLLTGLIKSFVFGCFIAIAACWKGLNTEGGTQGIGNTTTWVVVSSSIFVLVADFFLSKLFMITGLYRT